MDWSTCGSGTGTVKILTFDCLPILIAGIINWLLIFAGIIALFFIIFSGIKFLTSQGDPKQVEGARKTLTWAIVGFVLILSSFLIVRTISVITNVPLNTLGLQF